MSLYENNNYKVIVGQSNDPEKPGNRYLIVNKKTLVTEMDDTILSRSRQIADVLNKYEEEGFPEVVQMAFGVPHTEEEEDDWLSVYEVEATDEPLN